VPPSMALVNFCVKYKIRIRLHSFARGCPVFPTSLIEEMISPPLCDLGKFVEDHLTFYFFFLLACSAKTSSTVLNRSSKNEHPCLVPNLREKSFTFHH
jgi:hypothetical protein